MSAVQTSARPGRRQWSDRRRVIVFLLITVGVSWAAWPLVLLNPSSTPFLPYGPTVAAIVIAAIAGGRPELGALLRRLVKWRVHPGWYATALLLPVVLLGIPVLAMLASGVPVEITGPFPWASLPVILAVRTIAGGPLGEELGWRGFLLPILRKRHGALTASLLIGAIWGPWHLPLLLSGPSTDQRPVLQFLLWVLAASVLHTWMYERTGGSVLLVTLFHGVLNTAASLLMPLFDGGHYATAWWLATATMTAAAATVVRYHRGPDRPGPPRLRVCGGPGAGGRPNGKPTVIDAS